MLLDIEEEAENQLAAARHDDPLPNREWNHKFDSLEFSAYTPPDEAMEGKGMTWQLLHNVVDGLNRYLVDRKTSREAYFKIFDHGVFVGFGHLIEVQDAVR